MEDSALDIVGKATRGLKKTPFAEPKNDSDLKKIAKELGLGEEALIASFHKRWTPQPVEKIEGLLCFNTPFEDMTVNSYLVYDPVSGSAAAFDTGADCGGMLEAGKKIETILITHIHTDHILELDRLKEKTGAIAYVSDREPIEGAVPFSDGKGFSIGSLQVETRRSSGHAKGGVTYFVTGLAKPLAIVGDALFAGSMGGGMVSYEEALKTTRENILSLPDETVVCSGHGPLTTVGEEKRNNPFFTK